MCKIKSNNFWETHCFVTHKSQLIKMAKLLSTYQKYSINNGILDYGHFDGHTPHNRAFALSDFTHETYLFYPNPHQLKLKFR